MMLDAQHDLLSLRLWTSRQPFHLKQQRQKRQGKSIRAKYATMQTAIDAASTVDEIKASMP
jgi:hypothetical protein